MMPYSKSKHTLRASAVLTGSYVASTVISMDRQNYFALLVQYTKGDETSLNIKIESSIDEGTTYGSQVTETTSGANVAVALAQYDFTATGNYWIVISPMLADTIKVSAKATGGSPTGTLALNALTGSV